MFSLQECHPGLISFVPLFELVYGLHLCHSAGWLTVFVFRVSTYAILTMGWKEGTGLGGEDDGQVDPV
jgi:hypothetical protein